jgi:galactose mutarotase-like enzyme
MFKTGQTIKITKPARAYKMAGIIDPTCILPEEVKIMKIVRVSNTKGGTKIHVRGDEPGHAIYVEQFLANPGFSIEVVA